MKIEFTGVMKDLNNKSLNDGSISKQIANIIATEKSELDTIKAYQLSIELYNGGSIDVEKDTVEKIKKAVEKNESLVVFAKAQLLLRIDTELKKFK